jgi:hypothetical protein
LRRGGDGLGTVRVRVVSRVPDHQARLGALDGRQRVQSRVMASERKFPDAEVVSPSPAAGRPLHEARRTMMTNADPPTTEMAP